MYSSVIGTAPRNWPTWTWCTWCSLGSLSRSVRMSLRLPYQNTTCDCKVGNNLATISMFYKYCKQRKWSHYSNVSGFLLHKPTRMYNKCKLELGITYLSQGVTKNGENVAVKMLHDVNTYHDDKQFQNEFFNLCLLKHQNIVQILGYC